jgi:dephospho-CoA kinase
MIVVGLTGSVASGKSTVASWIEAENIPVYDADAMVHWFLKAGGLAVEPILVQFGNSVLSDDGGIDRKKLGNNIFGNAKNRQILETILHPMVRQHRDQFLHYRRQEGESLVILNIPLLFETGGDQLCDYIIVVYACDRTLKQRALNRDGMTIEKLTGILAAQMPNKDKKQRADLSLNTDCDYEVTRHQLFSWLNNLPKQNKILRT